MTLAERLEECTALTTKRLEQLLADTSLPGAPARLTAAMRYAVLGGGKRFRPFLVIEGARLFGVPPDAALDSAAAIECLHCYSLVHDDLPAMDDDKLRRGLPTVHIKFDEATAILAGDALLTFAFEILARPETHPDPAVRSRLVLGLAQAAGAGGMVGGQQLDLEAGKRQVGAAADLAEVRIIQDKKTGALITFAAEAGAILAGAQHQERRALVAYGRALGTAFQVADDLLDVEGNTATVGKATRKDLAAGKATYVSALGVAGAKTKLAELEAEAIAAVQSFGTAARTLIDAAHFVVTRNR
jgi:farnesyl diphosphate synthase